MERVAEGELGAVLIVLGEREGDAGPREHDRGCVDQVADRLQALADGETVLKGALWSEDTQIMVECLQELGFMVNVEPDPNEPCNRTITVYGNGGAVPRGGTEAQPLELFVGNAGTAARFLAPFLCLGSGVYRLHGVPRMHERPQAAFRHRSGYELPTMSNLKRATTSCR